MNNQITQKPKRPWGGYVLSGLAILFLLFDSIIKVLKLDVAVEGTVELGYPASAVVGIGLTALICTILYTIPRTAVLGAVLLSGYLGGAIATHVRLGNPLFSHVLFPVYIALMIWGGLYLRDRALRLLLPLRQRQHEI
ncbi:MAG TPA: DoxX family protein [Cyclobacteriaceae bacterium]|nr:DoxX family protein [Cyclobacteriaceae bacterium]